MFVVQISPSSADCAIYTPGIGTCRHISSVENSAFAAVANYYNVAFLVPPGIHHYWDSMPSNEKFARHFTSSGNRTLDLLIPSQMPYPIGHMLPYVSLASRLCHTINQFDWYSLWHHLLEEVGYLQRDLCANCLATMALWLLLVLFPRLMLRTFKHD